MGDVPSSTDPEESDARARKRRGPEQVDLLGGQDGRLEVATMQMESFLVAHEGGNVLRAREELYKLTQSCKSLVERIETQRMNVFSLLCTQTSPPDLMGRVQQELPLVCQQIAGNANALSTLQSKLLLSPLELFQLRFLKQQFGLLNAYAQALRSEMGWAAQGKRNNPDGSVPFVGSLVVRSGGAEGMLTFKSKVLDEPFVVELVCGVSQPIRFGRVRCELQVGGALVSDGLEGAECDLDPEKKIAVFPQLRLATSSRMNLCAFVFSVDVTVADNRAPVTVRSAPSEPFIVLTHESQWAEGEIKSTMVHAVRDAKVVSWPGFANVLHARYLRASKQDFKNPERPLSMADLQYMYLRFVASTQVTVQQATRFLSWFSPVLQQIRFRRHVRTMWVAGIIFGFIDKDKCNQTLAPFPEGTFLLRFSESSPGLFAVAYVSDDLHERIKHYLVKQEDIAQKSLPDFIRGKPQWMHLLRLDSASSTLTRLHKDKALETFYSAGAQATQKQGGYTLL